MSYTYTKPHAVKGVCVHAGKNFKAGDLILASRALVLPEKETDMIWSSSLKFYAFSWPDQDGEWTRCCLAMGDASFLNHSDSPNCYWEAHSVPRRRIAFYALRDIRIHEELTHNYNWPKSWKKGFLP